MPDKVKIAKLQKLGWKKVECCANCKHASSGSQKKMTFGYCQHPDAVYKHSKQGDRKIPSHAGAVCDNYEPIYVPGLEELDKLTNPRKEVPHVRY